MFFESGYARKGKGQRPEFLIVTMVFNYPFLCFKNFGFCCGEPEAFERDEGATKGASEEGASAAGGELFCRKKGILQNMSDIFFMNDFAFDEGRI